MANLSNISNKFIVTDGNNGRVLIGATNDIGATLFANHPSTTAPSLTFNAPAGQVFENEDLQFAFGLNNASPYNGYMQTRFVSAPYYRNLAINPLGGDVGIGTNSPGTKLDVRGTGSFLGVAASGTALVTIENNSSSTATSYGLLVKGGGNSSSGKTFEVRDDSGNTDLIVKGNGNVGIGVQPSSIWSSFWKPLQINSGSAIAGYTSGSSVATSISTNNVTVGNTYILNNKYLVDGAASLYLQDIDGEHSWYNAASGTAGNTITYTERMRLKTPGSTIQDVTLQLKTTGTSDNAGIMFINSGNTSSFNDIAGIASFVESGSAKGNLQFWTRNSDGDNSDVATRMTINSSGNVGIGTTSPTESKLVISGGATGTVGGGDAGITMINKFDNPDNSWSILPVITGVANTGFSIRDNTDSTDRLVIDGSGNVGIGTSSPNDKLEVSGGNIRIYSTNNANHLIIKNNATATSGTFEERIKFLGWNDSENAAITGIGNAYFGSPVNALTFSVSGVEAIRIKNGGQVRIGDGDSEQLAAIRLGGENAAGGRLFLEYNGDNSYIDSYGGHGSTQRYRDLTFAARNLIFTTGNTSGSEKMRISDAGDVSVNDTSANNCTLHINSYQKNAGNAARIGNMQICMEGNGSAYPNIGYGQRSTTSTTGFVYQQSDYASWFRFHAGGIQSYTAPSGTSGNAISFTTGPYISQGGTSWTSGSDINLKENIKPLNKVLDKIKDYRCVEYSLKSDANKSKKIGFIAQDWEQDFAQVIEKDNEENLGIKYSETIPILLKAIQELKAEIELLKSK